MMDAALLYTFTLHRQVRENLRTLLGTLTTEQLNTVPAGCSNNLIWNAGHVVATSELLTYGLGGHALPSGSDFVNRYRKGTRPEGSAGTEEIAYITRELLDGHTRIREDFEKLDWSGYTPYTPSFGATFSTIAEAVTYNNLHETMHLGTMLVLRRLV